MHGVGTERERSLTFSLASVFLFVSLTVPPKYPLRSPDSNLLGPLLLSEPFALNQGHSLMNPVVLQTVLWS